MAATRTATRHYLIAGVIALNGPLTIPELARILGRTKTAVAIDVGCMEHEQGDLVSEFGPQEFNATPCVQYRLADKADRAHRALLRETADLEAHPVAPRRRMMRPTRQRVGGSA